MISYIWLFLILSLSRFPRSLHFQVWQGWTMPRSFYNSAPVIQFQGYQPPPSPPLREEYRSSAHPPGFIPQQQFRPAPPPQSLMPRNRILNQPRQTPQQSATFQRQPSPPRSSIQPPLSWTKPRNQAIDDTRPWSSGPTSWNPPAPNSNGVIQMFDDNSKEATVLPEVKMVIKPTNNNNNTGNDLEKELEKELEKAIPQVLTEIQKLHHIPAIHHPQPSQSSSQTTPKNEVNEEDLGELIEEGFEEAEEETKGPKSTVSTSSRPQTTQKATTQTTLPLQVSTQKISEAFRPGKFPAETPTLAPHTLPVGIATEFIDLQPIELTTKRTTARIPELHTLTEIIPKSEGPPELVVPVATVKQPEQQISVEPTPTSTSRKTTTIPEFEEAKMKAMLAEMEVPVTAMMEPIETEVSTSPTRPSKTSWLASTSTLSTRLPIEETTQSVIDEEKMKAMMVEMEVPAEAMEEVFETTTVREVETEQPNRVPPETTEEAKATEITLTTTEALSATEKQLEIETTTSIHEFMLTSQDVIVQMEPEEETRTEATTAKEIVTTAKEEIPTPELEELTTTTQILLSTHELTEKPIEMEATVEETTETTVLEVKIEATTTPMIDMTTIKQRICPIPNDDAEDFKGDVLFLLDSSTSVGKEQFERALRLVEKTVSHFKNIGPNGVQVSLVQYNREPFLEFSFRKHDCLPDLIEDIRATEFMNGVSNLGKAIEKVMKFAFNKMRGDRPDVENVLVLVTDGQADDKIQFPYTLYDVNGTTVFVIATLEANMNDLLELTQNDHDKVFDLSEALHKPLAQRLAESIKNLLAKKSSMKPSEIPEEGADGATQTMTSASEYFKSTSVPSDVSTNLIEAETKIPTTIGTEKVHEVFPVEALTSLPIENATIWETTNPENHELSTTESLETMVEHAISEELENELGSTTEFTPIKTTEEGLEFEETETLPFEPVELIETTPQTISVEIPVNVPTPSSKEDVTIECLPDGLRAYFRLPSNYTGVIAAKDHEDDANCFVDVAVDVSPFPERIVPFEVGKGECGLHAMESTNPKGTNQTIVLNVLHNKRLVTSEDRAYIIECYSPIAAQESEVETKLDIGQGLPWSKTVQVQAPAPKCHYSLRRDSPNGPLISFARIGETIYHRWECDGGKNASHSYGIHVHSCRAGNNSENVFNLVDSRGCSTDNALLKELTYAEDELVAYAKSQVFTLVNVEALKFTCKVSLCVRDGDGCEGISPPSCPGSNTSEVLLTRTTRRCDEALEAALTSELEASIKDLRDPSMVVEIRRYLAISPIALAFGAIVLGLVLGGLFYILRDHSGIPSQKFDTGSISSEYMDCVSVRSLNLESQEPQECETNSEIPTDPSSTDTNEQASMEAPQIRLEMEL